MSSKKVFPISAKEYQQKRYEAAKDILVKIVSIESLSKMNDNRQRESLVYTSIQLTEIFLIELGFVVKNEDTSASDGTKLRTISSLLDSVRKPKSEDDVADDDDADDEES